MEKEESIKCELCKASDCFMKKYAESNLFTQINENKNVIKFRKGQYIFYESNFVEGLFFIKNGKVKIFYTREGQDQIIRLANTGKILGHRGIGGNNIYPISAIALEDSFICFLPKKILEQQLKNNATLSYQFTMFYASELMQSEKRWHSFSRTGLREKVIGALVMIIHSFHNEVKNGDLIDLYLTRKEIGDIVLSSAEQISREFTWLKEQEIIDVIGRKKIIIKDYDKLVGKLSNS